MNSLGFDKKEKDTKVIVAMSGCDDSSVAAVKLINMFKNKKIVGAGFIINLPELKGEEILNKMGIKTHSLMEF